MRIVSAVAAQSNLPPELAEEYIVAVIATLEARLSFTDVYELEAELPEPLRMMLHREPIVDVPDLDEDDLFDRVSERLAIGRHEAEVISRIVLRVLRSSLSALEVAHLEAQLSRGLRVLWRSGPETHH